jgi:DNA-binding winged helix-turn-helix (wHTH) protein
MSHIYRFGEYRVDPLTRELHRGDSLLPLSPKVFDCVAYLIEHRDRAIGRDELVAAVWGRADVSDDMLAQTLLRARRSVGDTGNEQRAIRTIPRFGYRWVLAVETDQAGAHDHPPALAVALADDPAPEHLPATLADRTTDAQRGLLRPAIIAIATIAIIVLAMVGIGVLQRERRSDASATTAAAPLLMVLPVDVSGAGRDATWIRLGAMDFIASRVREDSGLKVLPTSQTLVLIGRDDTPAQHDAGELHRLELSAHAAYIVVPRAHFSAQRWHVTLDVYHDGGSRSFDAEAANPLDATTRATARFLASLGIEVSQERASNTPLTELVQRVDAAMLAGDLDEARRLVDAAPVDMRNDPTVTVRTGQIAFRAGQLDAAAALFGPLASNDPALAPSVRAQAQMGLGAVAVRHQDFDAAERDYTAAIDTLAKAGGAPEPTLLGDAYIGRGVANGARDRFDEALGDLGRARMELDRAGDNIGAASVDVNLGIITGIRGRYIEAEGAFDRAIATFTRFGVRDNLAASLLGKTEAQLALVDRTGALSSSQQASELAAHLENPILVERIAATRARALLASGQLDAAAQVLDRHADPAGVAKDDDFALLQAELRLERGDAAGALRGARALLDQVSRKPDPSDDARASGIAYVMLEAARRGGRIADAEPALAALRSSKNPARDRDRPMMLELLQAQLAAARSDASAADHFVAALAEADRSGAPLALVRSGAAYAHYLIDRHSLDQATAIVGRLAAYADKDFTVARATAALYEARGDHRLAEVADGQARALAGQRDIRLAW